MLEINFTEIDKPFTFIKELMEGYSDEEIHEAHQNYCLYLNQLQRTFNELELGVDID